MRDSLREFFTKHFHERVDTEKRLNLTFTSSRDIVNFYKDRKIQWNLVAMKLQYFAIKLPVDLFAQLIFHAESNDFNNCALAIAAVLTERKYAELINVLLKLNVEMPINNAELIRDESILAALLRVRILMQMHNAIFFNTPLKIDMQKFRELSLENEPIKESNEKKPSGGENKGKEKIVESDNSKEEIATVNTASEADQTISMNELIEDFFQQMNKTEAESSIDDQSNFSNNLKKSPKIKDWYAKFLSTILNPKNIESWPIDIRIHAGEFYRSLLLLTPSSAYINNVNRFLSNEIANRQWRLIRLGNYVILQSIKFMLATFLKNKEKKQQENFFKAIQSLMDFSCQSQMNFSASEPTLEMEMVQMFLVHLARCRTKTTALDDNLPLAGSRCALEALEKMQSNNNKFSVDLNNEIRVIQNYGASNKREIESNKSTDYPDQLVVDLSGSTEMMRAVYDRDLQKLKKILTSDSISKEDFNKNIEMALTIAVKQLIFLSAFVYSKSDISEERKEFLAIIDALLNVDACVTSNILELITLFQQSEKELCEMDRRFISKIKCYSMLQKVENLYTQLSEKKNLFKEQCNKIKEKLDNFPNDFCGSCVSIEKIDEKFILLCAKKTDEDITDYLRTCLNNQKLDFAGFNTKIYSGIIIKPIRTYKDFIEEYKEKSSGDLRKVIQVIDGVAVTVQTAKDFEGIKCAIKQCIVEAFYLDSNSAVRYLLNKSAGKHTQDAVGELDMKLQRPTEDFMKILDEFAKLFEETFLLSAEFDQQPATDTGEGCSSGSSSFSL